MSLHLFKKTIDDSRYEKGVLFRRNKTTRFQWMPFCPVPTCGIPLYPVEGFDKVCCQNLKCGWTVGVSGSEILKICSDL
jgi:hypothetical protein